MSLRRQLLSRFQRKQPIFFPPQKHAYLLTTTAALQYAILKCARSFREASEESNLENCENCLSWSCCSKQGLKMGQGKLKATRISSCGCATRNLPALMVRLKQKTFCHFSLWLPVGAWGLWEGWARRGRRPCCYVVWATGFCLQLYHLPGEGACFLGVC